MKYYFINRSCPYLQTKLVISLVLLNGLLVYFMISSQICLEGVFINLKAVEGILRDFVCLLGPCCLIFHAIAGFNGLLHLVE